VRLLTALVLLLLLASPICAETYGNFSTMGVIVDCPPGDTPRAIGRIEAYLVRAGERRRVHDFVQVASALEPRDYFATSLFDLQPDTEYTLEVEYYNRGGELIAKHTEVGRTRPEPVVPETARALFVSPAGDDRNPGTLARPFRTLKAAFAALTPGTTLYLREGRYYEGGLVVPRGGTKDAPIVIRGYHDEKVILDCAYPELVFAKWSRDADGIYSTPLAEMSWNVSVEHKQTGAYYRCYPMRTREELVTQQSAGKSFARLGLTGAYHWDGKLLHLLLPEGKIEDYRVHVGKYGSALEATGCSYLFVDGLEFRHSTDSQIKLRDTAESLVQRCRFLYSSSGVLVKGDSSNNTVQDCQYLDDTNHWSFAYAKTEDGWGYHGYVETGLVCVDGKYSGRGLVVRRNRIANCFDGSHLCPWSVIKARTSETDFYDNEITDVADDFLETDGYSRNVRIFDNRMRGCLSGISIAQALDGPTWVVRNVIADFGVCKATRDGEFEGYPVKANGGDGADDIGTGTVLFYHNTSSSNDDSKWAYAFLVKQAMWRKLLFRNNIWCGKREGIHAYYPRLWPVDWDYDDIYHETGPFAQIGDSIYQTLDDFRQGNVLLRPPRYGRPAGIREHLISANPQFQDAPNGDYRLRPDSPCVDAGVIVPGINDLSYRGKAPDMGAAEAEAR
jgi:hypothetical protein